MTHRVFSYGTLRQDDVQAALFGRAVPTVPDRLPGYRLDWLTITDPDVIATSGTDRHPVLRRGGADDVVDGAYLELDDAELARADDYEVEDYVRVETTLASGVSAWVYVAADGAGAGAGVAGTGSVSARQVPAGPDEEAARIAALRDAEAKASQLFAEVVARGLLVPGKGERRLSDEIRDLAGDLFGVERFWHKRIVRSGVNTLEPYRSNPPDRIITDDEIVFLDFGPIFAEWEADFGRTYVLGDDPAKHRLAESLPVIWERGRDLFRADPAITGAQLFTEVLGLIRDAGWGHGATHVGHLVGEFPHERVNGDEVDCYITTGNDLPMRRPDAGGRPCHWILEVHLIDRERSFGGFFEQLLDI